MITIEQAYKILKNDKNNQDFDTVLEFKDMYVFSPIKNKNGIVLASLYSVNKINGKVKPFIPFEISSEEFKNAKRYKL